MNKLGIRKLVIIALTLLISISLSGCIEETDNNSDPDSDPVVENTAPEISGTSDFAVAYGQSVNFTEGITATDEEDGELTSSIQITTGEFDSETPGTYEITYSVTDSEGLSDTETVIVTVNEEEGPSAEEMIAEDMAYYAEHQFFSPERLNLYNSGGVYQSSITWVIDSPYVAASNGLILPPTQGSETITVEYTGTFTIGDVSITETYSIPIEPIEDVVLSTSRDVPFTNLTTEYEVDDGSLPLYFEEDGSVPYVDLESFFGLLEGFVDPTTDITFTQTEDTLTLFYEYYSEEEDELYDLEVVIDATSNTITTNDMGFYWAYVYSTETNYGRHIEYVDHLDEHTVEGDDVIYSLNEYRLDIVENETGIYLPYYLANQLFAGSSYYNVYYNNDGLYGIYSLPETDSDEFDTIHTSSKNDSFFTQDLLLHNYDMLAFNLDHFYGLKDYYEIDTFYTMLGQYEDDLLSFRATDFDDGLFRMLNRAIDEPHTSYGYPSYYTKSSNKGPSIESLADFGTQTRAWYDNLYDIDDAIGSKWGEAEGNSWNANSTYRPYYWFLDDLKTSVVISLDDFNTSDIVESATYDIAEASDVLDVTDSSVFLPEITEGSKFFFYNSSTDMNNILEILVKDVSVEYYESYKTLLENEGYTFTQQYTDNEDKDNGYFSKTVGDITYMVQVNYDATYGLLYVGIADELPETYEDDWLIYSDVMGTAQADSAVYLEVVFDKLAVEAPNLENVMLDITWNTGGNVGSLYRVVGFITDQPFRVSSISADSGAEYSSYVQIDGIPYNPNLNWSLLTSGVSFSAANTLATIFSENDLGPIIGITTGGGTASITPVLLPSGTAFTMSSNSLGALRLGSGTETDPYEYLNNEEGITPDIVITIEDIYDETVLLSAFDE